MSYFNQSQIIVGGTLYIARIIKARQSQDLGHRVLLMLIDSVEAALGEGSWEALLDLLVELFGDDQADRLETLLDSEAWEKIKPVIEKSGLNPEAIGQAIGEKDAMEALRALEQENAVKLVINLLGVGRKAVRPILQSDLTDLMVEMMEASLVTYQPEGGSATIYKESDQDPGEAYDQAFTGRLNDAYVLFVKLCFLNWGKVGIATLKKNTLLNSLKNQMGNLIEKVKNVLGSQPNS